MPKLGSLFDGSGGFPLAGILNGIKPVWASEIEPYPMRVTAARLPCMKQLGDVTKINGAEIEPVDIVTFGSPCQDLSTAGKREGIHKGQRSSLFFEAIRIIREMRIATNGRYPAFAVWENVPGAFSSNRGEDFRCVLEELAKTVEGGLSVPRPPRGTWKPAGLLVGNGFSIAWRVLDAQYWGVPQRRRRIYLVADFAGGRAGEILFERESLRGDSAEGKEARKETSEDARGSLVRSDSVECVKPSDDVVSIQGSMIDRTERSGPQGSGVKHNISFTLNTRDRHAIAFIKENEIVSIHDKATRSKGGGNTRHDDGAANGLGVRTDGIMYTIDTECRHAIAFAREQEDEQMLIYPKLFHTITATNARCVESAQQPNCVAIPTCYTQKKFGEFVDGIGTLTAENADDASRTGASIICIAHGQANAEIMDDLSPTLNCNHEQPIIVGEHDKEKCAVTYDTTQITSPSNRSNPHPGDPCYTLSAESHPPLCMIIDQARNGRKYIVRRLTPLECCRLQGFPDWWTDGVEGSDSAQYKMWGNGIALPCAVYVLERIAKAIRRSKNYEALCNG